MSIRSVSNNSPAEDLQLASATNRRLLQTLEAYATTYTAPLVAYPGYSGSLTVSGIIGVTEISSTSERIDYTLSGLESSTEGRIAFHSGTSCQSNDLVGEYLFGSSNDSNSRTIKYMSTSKGTSIGSLVLESGYRASQIVGRVVVLEDSRSVRVACGIVTEAPGLVKDDLLDGVIGSRDLFTKEEIRDGAVVLYIFGILYMFVALAIVCDEYFVPSLEIIAEKLEISNEVAGATLMAAGGSAPELATSFFGTFNRSAVGFGAIVGSAVFNVLFVIAMCAIFSKEVLTLTWWPLFRDSVYYAVSLIVLAIFFATGYDGTANVIELWEALVLFGMYLGYVLLMKYHQKAYTAVQRCRGKPMGPETAEENVAFSVKREGGNDVNVTNDRTRLGSPKTSDSSKLRSPKMKPDAHFRRPSTFRAGLVQLMTHNKPILDTVGVHVVQEIQGNILETFLELDQDKSGYIETSEVQELLLKIGLEVTPEQVDQVFEALDANEDGRVSFEEFQAWYIRSEERIRAEVKAVYEEIDEEVHGHLQKEDVQKLLSVLNPNEVVTPEELEEVWTELQASGAEAGMISESEFEKWYTSSDFFKRKKELTQQEADEAEGLSLSWPAETRAQLLYLFILPIAVPLYFTLPPHNPAWRKLRWGIIGFIGSIIWIGGYSYLMVWWTEITGATFGIPSVVMGLTLLAAGTSIPDLLSSVIGQTFIRSALLELFGKNYFAHVRNNWIIVARQGEGDMAVSSSLGKNQSARNHS